MKIFRGPKSKDFSDDSHELVGSADLSKDSKSWTDGKRYEVPINKNAYERLSVANINMSEEDVLALSEGLIKGIIEERKKIKAELELAKKRFAKIQKIIIKRQSSPDLNHVFQFIKTLTTQDIDDSKIEWLK